MTDALREALQELVAARDDRVEAWESIDEDGTWIAKAEARYDAALLAARTALQEPAPAPSQPVEDARYTELIMAVARKWPGETRHQTALRYIRQAESANLIDTGAKASIAKGVES